MGFLDDIRNQVVGLDTAPLIYFIEKNPVYAPKLRPFFVALAAGQFQAVTSTITLAETLVHPLRLGKTQIAQQYRDILLKAPNLTTFDLTPAVAQKTAEIRAVYAFKTPDAIQLATAVYGEATFFLTNDHHLKRFDQFTVLLVDDLI